MRPGLLVAAFADANAGLRRLALSGERLAGGDLAVDVQPLSERDVVAVALAHVTDVIRTVVGNVRATAELLERSASSLAARADQFVADARGNFDDLTSASGTMESLDSAVSRVAQDARELSAMAVGRARDGRAPRRSGAKQCGRPRPTGADRQSDDRCGDTK